MAKPEEGFNKRGIRVYYVEDASTTLVKINLSEQDRSYIPKPEEPLPAQIDAEEPDDDRFFESVQEAMGDSIGSGNELSSGDTRDLEYEGQMGTALENIIARINASKKSVTVDGEEKKHVTVGDKEIEVGEKDTITLKESESGTIIKGIPKGHEKAFAKQLGKALLEERQNVIKAMIDAATGVQDSIIDDTPAPAPIPAGGPPQVSLTPSKRIDITIPYITQGNFEQIPGYDPAFYNRRISDRETLGERLEAEYRETLAQMVEEYYDLQWEYNDTNEMSTALINEKHTSHWPLRHQAKKGTTLADAIRDRLEAEYKNFPQERYTQERLKHEIKTLEGERQYAESKLSTTENEVKSLQEEIERFKERQEQLTEQLAEKNADTGLIGGAIQANKGKIAAAEQGIEKQEELLKGRQEGLARLDYKIATRRCDIAKAELGSLDRAQKRFKRRTDNAAKPLVAASKQFNDHVKAHTKTLLQHEGITRESIEQKLIGSEEDPQKIAKKKQEADQEYKNTLKKRREKLIQATETETETAGISDDLKLKLISFKRNVEDAQAAYDNVHKKFSERADTYENKALEVRTLAIKVAETALKHAEITGNSQRIDASIEAIAARQASYDKTLAAVEQKRAERVAAQAAPAAEPAAEAEPDEPEKGDPAAAAEEALDKERKKLGGTLGNVGKRKPTEELKNPRPTPREPGERDDQERGGIGGIS